MSEPTPAPTPPVLGYAVPPVLFRGEYRCRNVLSCTGIAAGVGMGVLMIWIAGQTTLATGIGLMDRLIIYLLRIGGVAFLAWAIYGIWFLVTTQGWEVLITEDGMTRRGRLYPWRGIDCFCAARIASHVALQFRCKSGFPAWHALELTPALTVEEYKALARTLIQHLSPKYPHLRIEIEPRDSN